MLKKILRYSKNRIILLMRLFRISIFKILSYIYRPILSKQHYWLLLERGNDAQDNAWHFFQYLVSNHPEVNVLFAIHKKSPDYHSNLSKYEKLVIEYDSFMYYMVLYNCQVVISTHVHSYVKEVWGSIVGGWLDTNAKKVLIQHGIIHNHMSAFIYPKLHINLMCCGAKNEYEIKKNVFGYPESFLCYAGLARFDNLHHLQTKKQVLIMPTWRMKYSHLTREEFEKTDFFKSYKSILSNQSLLEALDVYDYSLVYYNHYEFQKFNDSLKPFCSRRIQMISFGEQSVQQLLRDSALLVTDYSSIYYDFLYMKKPIIFFLLNQEDFRASQYGEDYDDPNDFGDVVLNSDDVVAQILRHLQHGCIAEKRCVEHSRKVFPLYDQQNRERIYQGVLTLLQ